MRLYASKNDGAFEQKSEADVGVQQNKVRNERTQAFVLRAQQNCQTHDAYENSESVSGFEVFQNVDERFDECVPKIDKNEREESESIHEHTVRH